MNHDELEPLSDFAQSLVELEKQRPAPALPEAELYSRLSSSLGFALLPPLIAPPPAVAPSAGLLVKVLVGAALVGGGGLIGGGAVALRAEREQAELRAELQALREAVPPEPVAPAPALPTSVAPVAPVLPERTRAPARPIEREQLDPLRDENVLLERARTALLRREAGAALTALEQHARTHPKGRLSEERDALLVQVLVQLQRGPEALLKAREFGEKYPRSVLRASVEAAIDSAR